MSNDRTQAAADNSVLKEIWIVVGEVTDPERKDLGAVEYQFSDGPPNIRGSSNDYTSLEEGMRQECPAIFHWVD